MAKISLLLSLPILSLFLFLFPTLSYSRTLPINVWPKPIIISWPIPRATPLSPSFQILSPYPHHPYLHSAVARYTRLLFSEHYHPIVPPAVNLSSSPPLRSLSLSISDLSSPLRHGVDESYSLSISSSTGLANLTAITVWGAMRGLETFSQLSWGDPPVIAADVYIADRPIFPHRGVMLDTSRNYYPVEDIVRTIEAMGANKLNVFHWHITDSHSFPIVLPSEPELAGKGSYGPGMRYTPEDVKAIVELGMTRGVRVLPEIDAPG